MDNNAIKKAIAYIDSNKEQYIDILKNAVSIKSVSGDDSLRDETINMAQWLRNEMEKREIKTELRDLGFTTNSETGKQIKLPPLVYGCYGDCSDKSKVLLIYGHYDVQPARKEDGWNSDPFSLQRTSDDRLVGRGSTDDKGPVLAWLFAIEAINKVKKDLKISFNLPIQFVFEGMEESGSVGLDDCLRSDDFYKGIKNVAISDSYWLGTRRPALTHGLRGIIFFRVTVTGPKADLHSGSFGGCIHEPMGDLIRILSSLIREDGEPAIEGILTGLRDLTSEERESLSRLDLTISEFERMSNNSKSRHQTTDKLLEHRWRRPSLSIHGIEGAHAEIGAKTVIPGCVTGKFSVRLAANQDPNVIENLVRKHIDKYVKNILKTRNEVVVKIEHGAKAWLVNPNSRNYKIAKEAIKKVYDASEIEMICEGGSIPVTLTFTEEVGADVVHIPIGRCDDGAHSTNEKIDVSNYINGIKCFVHFLTSQASSSSSN